MSDENSDSEKETAPKLKCTYSRHLRDKIMQINPYRIPCMYMQVLEENAVQTLLDVSEMSKMSDANCETDYPTCLADKESWQLWLPPRDSSQNWRETDQTTFTSTDMTGTELKQSASLSDLATYLNKEPQRDTYSTNSCPRPRQAVPGLKKVEQAWPEVAEKKVKEPKDSNNEEESSCGHDLPGTQVLKQYEFSPWRTCNLHPLEKQYARLYGEETTSSPSSSSSFSSRTPSSRPRLVRSSSTPRTMEATCRAGSSENINTVQKFLKWRPGDSKVKKASSGKTGSLIKSPPGSGKEKQSGGKELTTMYTKLIGKPDTQFIFEHHRSHRSYMRHYKTQVTYKKLYPSMSGTANESSKSYVTQVHMHCADVRDGASLKVSQFQFKVNPMLRTKSNLPNKEGLSTVSSYMRSEAGSLIPGTPQWTSPASSRTPSSAPSPASGKRSSAAHPPSPAGGKRSSAPHPPSPASGKRSSATHPPSPAGGKRPSPAPSPAGGKTSSSAPASSVRRATPPMVCRSRPSIPSNARGVVCATAVETPSHVVRRIQGRIDYGRGPATIGLTLNIGPSKATKKDV